MQNLINTVALLSGLVSLTVLGSGVYLYKNSDVLIEDFRNKITKTAVETIQKTLPELVNTALPETPKTTGLPIPVK